MILQRKPLECSNRMFSADLCTAEPQAQQSVVILGICYHLPSGYLTVRHGKSPFFIGKPSISMGHLYHGYVSHNQRVPGINKFERLLAPST